MTKRALLVLLLALCAAPSRAGAPGTTYGSGTYGTGTYGPGASSYWGSPGSVGRRPILTHPNDFWYNAIYRVDPSTGISDGTGFVRRTPSYANWQMGPEYMNLARAWSVTTGSDAVVVAVIDQEIQWDHYDLVDNIWVNPGETAGNGVDDDGNGLVDDARGWNFLSMTGDPAHAVAQGDYIRAADSQHGTQMAGILGAQGDNESWTETSLAPNRTDQQQGSVGVAWDVSILPCKAIYSAAIREQPVFSWGTQTQAVEYLADLAANRGRSIVAASMSFEGVTSYMVSRLVDANILPITGSGNDTYEMEWATQPGSAGDSLLVASAVGAMGRKLPYAEWGPRIDLCGWGGGSSNNPGGPYYKYDAPPIGWRNIVAGWSSWPFFWTLGWAPVGVPVPAVAWRGNETSEAATGLTVDDIRPGVLPSPGMTSGAVPQIAGVAALIKTSFFAPATWSSLRALVLRGCKDRAAIESFADCTDSLGGNPCTGEIGAGAIDAYRAVTLWGKVPISTFPSGLSGNVYVSGDVLFTGGGVLTVAAGTTFWVAPDDLYADDIEANGNAPAAWRFNRATEITTEPAVRLSPAGACVYVAAGTFLNCGAGVTFRSWAETPGEADWEGIHVLTGGGVFGSYTVQNAAN